MNEKKHEKHDSRNQAEEANRGHLEYEASMPSNQLRRSI
jgi:hypothetical protein